MVTDDVTYSMNLSALSVFTSLATLMNSTVCQHVLSASIEHPVIKYLKNSLAVKFNVQIHCKGQTIKISAL